MVQHFLLRLSLAGRQPRRESKPCGNTRNAEFHSAVPQSFALHADSKSAVQQSETLRYLAAFHLENISPVSSRKLIGFLVILAYV